MDKSVLITGAAGFIGFHLSRRLLEEGSKVVGIDNMNTYYDVNLKKTRLAILKKYDNFTFHKIDIANRHAMETLFSSRFNTEGSSPITHHPSPITSRFHIVVHLAAQAGV